MKRRNLMKMPLAAAALSLTMGDAFAQDAEKVVIGVSIPSATHGFMGGLNWHEQDTIERLGETYPNLEFVLATAPDVGKQVSDIEDMLATRDIDGLVVLPFESEPLTDPVKQVKAAGKFVTVVGALDNEPEVAELIIRRDDNGVLTGMLETEIKTVELMD